MIYEDNSASAAEEDMRVTNAQICRICGETLGKHSFVGNNCPSNAVSGPLFLDSIFTDDLEFWYRFGKGAN